MRRNRWDIFCRVVDNFGDIGFCWRLARQLATEHELEVRLWVDDLVSFKHLCPAIEPRLYTQVLQGVEIRRWQASWPHGPADIESDPADVVIEAFACELPEPYLAAMAQRPRKPVWINLEYLSAEGWVGGCHALTSPHTRLPLTKHFYFPGFVAGTGGLLREAWLLHERAAWQADAVAAWPRLGLPPAKPDETSVSLFCYENPGLPKLLSAWAESDTALRCLIPDGAALVQAAACLGRASLRPGDLLRQGNLTLYALPFLSQDDYDRLLWLCDVNFVRGEDSFVRAQWAARPFVWQVYPQGQAVHMTKLAAFLDVYAVGLSEPAASACRTFWQSWNQPSPTDTAAAWADYWQCRDALSAQAAGWAERLAQPSDLATQLVNFCEDLL